MRFAQAVALACTLVACAPSGSAPERAPETARTEASGVPPLSSASETSALAACRTALAEQEPAAALDACGDLAGPAACREAMLEFHTPPPLCTLCEGESAMRGCEEGGELARQCAAAYASAERFRDSCLAECSQPGFRSLAVCATTQEPLAYAELAARRWVDAGLVDAEFILSPEAGSLRVLATSTDAAERSAVLSELAAEGRSDAFVVALRLALLLARSE